MRSVRIFFKKKDRLKFISHLDMNRFMTRVVRLSRIPIWYTEGFNPHPYITFALPLSLGFESDYEIMDIRLVNDEYTNQQVKEALEKAVPKYIEIVDAKDPVLKVGKISYARYKIVFSSFCEGLDRKLSAFLSQDSIKVEKKGKKGNCKVVDLADKIIDYNIECAGGKLNLYLTLPAGGSDNVNPMLLLNAFGELPYFRITRTSILDEKFNDFR